MTALFHRSRVTIHDAIRGGLPLNAAELQSALNDPEAWAQEYLCEFMDNSTVLLPYDLIETCESSLATERSSLESLSASAIPWRTVPALHNDPFDRMLIAQAISEGLTLVTSDGIIQQYPVSILKA